MQGTVAYMHERTTNWEIKIKAPVLRPVKEAVPELNC